MTCIKKRMSGLVLVLLAVACSGAFTAYGHAAAVPASGNLSVPSFMSAAPLFGNSETTTRAFASPGTRTAASTVSVTIWGPDTIQPNETCYWEANVSGGTPPYTYQWYGGSSSSRTQPEFWASASRSFWLDVKVTDSLGSVGWGSEYITVTSNTGLCPV